MKPKLNARMPWPADYFGLHVSRQCVMPKLERDEPLYRARTSPVVAVPIAPASIADLTERDIKRIKWARGAGLMGALYGGDGSYLLTAPAGIPSHSWRQGRWVTTAGLREHLTSLEIYFEREYGTSKEKHNRRAAG